MQAQENALRWAKDAYEMVTELEGQLEAARTLLCLRCQQAHEAGVSDREISEVTKLSRARIQQIRTKELANV